MDESRLELEKSPGRVIIYTRDISGNSSVKVRIGRETPQVGRNTFFEKKHKKTMQSGEGLSFLFSGHE